MPSVRVHQSVVTRLVLFLVVGGVGASIVLGLMALQRGEAALNIQLASDVAADMRRIEEIIESADHSDMIGQLHKTLPVIASRKDIIAVRVTDNDKILAINGHWPDGEADSYTQVNLTSMLNQSHDFDFDHPTHVMFSFMHHHDDKMTIDLLIDGKIAYAEMRSSVMKQLAVQWLLTAALTLIGLIMLRRWVMGPLGEISELVSRNAAASSFYRCSRQFQGEYSQLAQAIAGMLTRIDSTSQRLKQRETAFQSLYQFAPAAMVSLDVAGLITEANQRAAQLLHAKNEQELLGKSITEFVKMDDRPTLRNAITRLQIHDATRCELTMKTNENPVDVVIECAAVRDEDAAITSTRLAFHDVTAIKELQAARENQTALLNLLIDHMSDAIALIDDNGRIAACNQRLVTLLGRDAASVRDGNYDATTFWETLGPIDEVEFIKQLQQLERQTDRPAEHRVDTRRGVFRFHCIPVHDANSELVGRLWVVEEITSQEQTQRLIDQQSQLLAAMRHVGHALIGVHTTDQVMEKTVERLSHMLGVEAVGMALRGGGHRRTRQLVNLGDTYCRLDTVRPVVAAIEQDILPIVLAQNDATCWTEMPRKCAWSKAMNHAGLTSLAAVALRGPYDMHGMIWIARRGGERLDRHQIYMLEILSPVIAARIEAVWSNEWLQTLSWLDEDTGLPTSQHLHAAMWTRQRGMDDTTTLIVADCADALKSLDANGATAGITSERMGIISNRLRAMLRKEALLARVGDARFAVLLENASDSAMKPIRDRVERTIADTIRQWAGEDQELTPPRMVHVTWPQEVGDLFDLLPNAERRLQSQTEDDLTDDTSEAPHSHAA